MRSVSQVRSAFLLSLCWHKQKGLTFSVNNTPPKRQSHLHHGPARWCNSQQEAKDGQQHNKGKEKGEDREARGRERKEEEGEEERRAGGRIEDGEERRKRQDRRPICGLLNDSCNPDPHYVFTGRLIRLVLCSSGCWPSSR